MILTRLVNVMSQVYDYDLFIRAVAIFKSKRIDFVKELRNVVS